MLGYEIRWWLGMKRSVQMKTAEVCEHLRSFSIFKLPKAGSMFDDAMYVRLHTVIDVRLVIEVRRDQRLHLEQDVRLQHSLQRHQRIDQPMA